eukprot:1188077-Prorocentrum_minimum.AAC.3
MIRISYYEVWSDAESAAVFLQSVCYYHETRASEVQPITRAEGSEGHSQVGEAIFDKEDNLAVDFVAAAAIGNIIGNILGNIPAGAANHTC